MEQSLLHGDNQQETISTDLSWLAGILEGEGCVSLFRYYKRNKMPAYQPKIWLVINTDYSIIDEVSRICHENNIGHWVYLHTRMSNKHKQAKYVKVWGAKRIISLSQKLTPYIRGHKKENLRFLEEYCQYRIKQKSKAYTQLDEDAYMYMKWLNRKGCDGSSETTRVAPSFPKLRGRYSPNSRDTVRST